MTAVDRALSHVLDSHPVRARKLAALMGLPKPDVRAALVQMQRDGLAQSRDGRWTAGGESHGG